MTGELGQGSGMLRACCWLCGQVEARGPAGCYGEWDGDCWYSAELWTYQVSGLLQRAATDVWVLEALRTAVLHSVDEAPPYCFNRVHKTVIVDVEIDSSSETVRVALRTDSRLRKSVPEIERVMKEKAEALSLQQPVIIRKEDISHMVTGRKQNDVGKVPKLLWERSGETVTHPPEMVRM
eukprot:CAMPEP_0198230612 /NCGR_PEP_ID=MMETSP1445-20131203/114759_1 /TAXON_ID=36898 /ORGANISM="Pyramimonas sp., Strain CCMP2087" /LENGTH=179 /DNA_ID=CAMNT_0043911169 /DNA_START=319 /DNA_END=858 /DNA_ORIENTATION=+